MTQPQPADQNQTDKKIEEAIDAVSRCLAELARGLKAEGRMPRYRKGPDGNIVSLDGSRLMALFAQVVTDHLQPGLDTQTKARVAGEARLKVLEDKSLGLIIR